MFKFAIIFAIATLSLASDIDDIVGNATPVGVLTDKDRPYSQCASYFIRKTDVVCNCKNRINLPMIELTHPEEDIMDLQFIPIIVKSRDEAAAVLEAELTKDCECSPNKYEKDPALIQMVNDNYYITYVWKVGADTIESVKLIRKKVDSRAEYEAVIKAINFDKAKEYKQVCNVFTD